MSSPDNQPRLQEVLDAVVAYHPKANIDLIRKAYVHCARAHAGQVRKTGEPYLIHPVAVARILTQLRLDDVCICAGLLHDTVEDTTTKLEDIKNFFGDDVALLVDGVTKLSMIKFQHSEEKMAENFRKMLLSMSKDIRVLLVKLADRLHNMRTLEHMKPEKQEAIASETMQIYAPLANRLGVSWIKTELEDLSFRYLFPREYEQISTEMNKTSRDHEKLIEVTSRQIRTYLAENGIRDVDVDGRVKHKWSVHKKMVSKKIAFADVTDLIAFRVVSQNIPQCYEVLGYMHSKWRPIPGRFKDYIAIRKPNGYQSLHTTVIGPNSQRIEIQIRTPEMHAVAEQGIAAHWKYKESGSSVPYKFKNDDEFRWLRELMTWQKGLKDPTEFLDSVKHDLFADEIYVFTPRGDVIELPRKASPVDFAFAIHTDVGMTCTGAKVNGRMVGLGEELRSGDTCEVITNKNQRPSKAWLEFVKTSRAKNKIRAIVRANEREQAINIAREVMDRELKRYGENLNKYLKNNAIARVYVLGEDDKDAKDNKDNKDSKENKDAKDSKDSKDTQNLAGLAGKLDVESSKGTRAAPGPKELKDVHKYETIEDVLVAIGYGTLSAQSVLNRILPPEVLKSPQEAPKKSFIGNMIDKVARRSSSGIRIEGIDDILVHFARCCAPVHGEDVVGFVTRGRGLTVHRRDCPRVVDLDPERRIPVSWDSANNTPRFISLRVVTEDREGMLTDLSSAFAKNNVNISEAKCRVIGAGEAVNTFKCGISSLEQLRRVTKALQSVRGVHGVTRVSEVEP